MKQSEAYSHHLHPFWRIRAFGDHDTRWTSGFQEDGAGEAFCGFGDGEDLFAGGHVVRFYEDAVDGRHLEGLGGCIFGLVVLWLGR